MPEINYLAVLICGIASIAVGSIWYGPLFGKIWMEGMGFNKLSPEEQAKGMKMMPINYFQQFIASLVTAYVFANILWAFGVAIPDMTSTSSALQGAFWMWIGFIAPIKYAESLWTGKSFKYIAIDLGYWLVMLAVMGFIITSWVI